MANCKRLLVLASVFAACRALTRQSLNGRWIATADDNSVLQSMNASVPGGIFGDLANNGTIVDIFARYGPSNYSWVGTTDWTYTTTFTVDEELLLTYRIVTLVCEGLDTFATISINGEQVGQGENMFVRYVFDVKQHLLVGSNTISVSFASPVTRAAELKDDPANAYPIPPECPPDEYDGICFVNRIRKMQASFSWDWGPAFASMGIWKDIYLTGFDSATVDYVVAAPLFDTDAWNVEITTYLGAGAGDVYPVSGTVRTVLHLGNGTTTSAATAVSPPHLSITTVLRVPADSVNLWWPNGYGAQQLYDLTVTFESTEGERDEKNLRIGFRTVELVQEELGEGGGGGLSFYFNVNGYPIFAKGANAIPVNILPELGQDEESVRNILGSARDAHMNMLRVWGGGVYESDYFYDLADEYGILIWQDFMFACALYPADTAFLINVRAEVNHQLKRLGSHPSIAIWAGNNENEVALRQNWYTDENFDNYRRDYIQLYVDVIEAEVANVLPHATYVTSSPSNGLESDREDHVALNPGDVLYGDVHFYDYENDGWSTLTFPIPRFASEYGYQSMPSVDAWSTVTDNLDDVSPDGSFLEYRQHHPGGNRQNVDLIQSQLRLPDPSSPNYNRAFIFFSQIVQAQAVRIETEHYRSFKGRLDEDGRGNTMGALFWQLNDVWVAPTWSGIDYTGSWKMLHYFARDFFNPMIVTGRLVEENLELYAIFDGLVVPEERITTLLHIYKWDNLSPLLTIEFPVTLDPSQAVLVTTIHAPTALNAAGCGANYTEAKTRCFFHPHLIDDANNFLVPFNYIFPEKLYDSDLADANVQIESVQPSEVGFEIVVRTDAVALFVWLDSHEVKGRFSMNGFLQPLESWPIYFTADDPAVTAEELAAALTVTHLRDPAFL